MINADRFDKASLDSFILDQEEREAYGLIQRSF